MLGEKPPIRKKSLCRFYLRGLCVYSAKDCDFSHGVWDLDYDYWKEDEEIQYDYHKKRDDIQKNFIKGPRIYKDLYEFQNQKIFTLQQLNEKRQCRYAVRDMMHRQLYEQFMQLLEFKQIDTPFTESFLIRQFTRAGFNKILMGTMKFNSIAALLCDNPDSKYFKGTKIIPPNPNKQSVIVRKANNQEIILAYKKQYEKIIAESQKIIEQNLLKKKLFSANLPENVPPLNQILKQKKITLPQFLTELTGKQPTNIIFEASIQSIHKQASQFIHEKLHQKLITWNDIYIHLTKALKTNNGNILNQVKPHLVLEHNAFLFFPTHQFIYNPKVNSAIFSTLKQEPCKCNYQLPFPEQELLLDQMNWKGELNDGESFDINDFQSLMEYAPHILNSKILGVDLEGHLRKGGFVQMIQLNNGKNTFLLDIWYMNEVGDFQAFWLARKILRKVMIDPKIVKIFHDCRHDSIGLHEMMQTCIVNVFDTSASETLIAQLELYSKLWQNPHKDVLNDCKNTIAHCNNVKTPGLNQIFAKYKASHGINKNKERFHKMWSKGDISFFCKRPLDPDYRQYCIKDVLDLPEVYKKMLDAIPKQAVDIAYWISGQYAKFGYLSLEDNPKKEN